MQMHRQMTPDAESLWVSLVERLMESLPELADEFVARVSSIPAYTSDAVDGGELRETAEEVLRLMLDALADPTTYPRVQSYAAELGEKRARQGIPAEALTAAVRMDFPMIWGKMMELTDEELRPFLVHQVEPVWRVVDDYAVACYSSYIAARMREARLEVSMRDEFIAALFAPEGQLPEVQERFTRIFDSPATSQYAIAAVNGRPSVRMREAAAQPFRYLYEATSHSFLFWPILDRFARAPYEIPTELSNERCGLALSPEGLSGLAAASRRAVSLADQLNADDTAPLTIEQNWPRLARRQIAAAGFDFSKALDEALADSRPDEEERIRETVEMYMVTGSVAETASALYTHRNTVLNRLRRFNDLTGVDLRIPLQSAQVVVALLG